MSKLVCKAIICNEKNKMMAMLIFQEAEDSDKLIKNMSEKELTSFIESAEAVDRLEHKAFIIKQSSTSIPLSDRL